MESQVALFINEWATLENQDVIEYLRDGMRYVDNTNVDRAQFDQFLTFVESSYRQISLELVNSPLVQDNHIAAQWRLNCSQVCNNLVIPESVSLSGADFLHAFKGRLKSIDVYFNGKDMAVVNRLLLPAKGVASQNVTAINRASQVRYQKSGLGSDAMAAIAVQIESAMKIHKIFLNSDLNLAQLAKFVGVKPIYLSQTLNQYLKVSFFELLSCYRVEEAKDLLVHHAHKKILDVAYAAGFNSKSVFYGEFRKHTGMTPVQYRQSNHYC